MNLVYSHHIIDIYIGKIFFNENHQILISGPRINTAEGILLSGCGKVTVPWENPLSQGEITRKKLLQIWKMEMCQPGLVWHAT